ncbi:hypothetical protein NDR87_30845 [Nocardia sp. CDC159]|uniref:Uncharacterized protein n=1 Tax=Nocardia pulmonis TaxID=2951408 RepID=A0A9X2EC77_9NOCA|nr:MULTISPECIES: hypothetical protein [Nocardia]MCM6778052.1 hypothetical protein [Nocardia pulmonis]MCM6790777.1 hypothetical protein [Nocardia sp. CDC159]
MQNITIGRYGDDCGLVHRGETGAIERIEKTHAGWIEGIRDDGSGWIMFLDAEGSPCVFWASREPDGGVIGEGIPLG